MKKNIFLSVLLPVFAAAWLAGCKKEAPPPPPTPPTPTPTPQPGTAVFLESGHLVHVDLQTKKSIPLTSGSSVEWAPSLSPDGQWVLYWSNAETGFYNLWKIRVDGTRRTTLTEHEAHGLPEEGLNLLLNNAPAWNTKGDQVYFSFAGDLWRTSSEGYNPETLLSSWQACCPFPSKDEKTIWFVAQGRGSVYNLWALDLASREVTPVTRYTDWNVGSPSLSPDGRKILFNLFRDNVSQIHSMNTDGSNIAPVSADTQSFTPAWAQNGRKILYTKIGKDGRLQVWMMNASGTDPQPLGGAGSHSPSWGPRWVLPEGLPTPVSKPAKTASPEPVKPTPPQALKTAPTPTPQAPTPASPPPGQTPAGTPQSGEIIEIGF